MSSWKENKEWHHILNHMLCVCTCGLPTVCLTSDIYISYINYITSYIDIKSLGPTGDDSWLIGNSWALFFAALFILCLSANVSACLQEPHDRWPRMLNLTRKSIFSNHFFLFLIGGVWLGTTRSNFKCIAFNDLASVWAIRKMDWFLWACVYHTLAVECLCFVRPTKIFSWPAQIFMI